MTKDQHSRSGARAVWFPGVTYSVLFSVSFLSKEHKVAFNTRLKKKHLIEAGVVKSAHGSRSLRLVSLLRMCYYELPTFHKLIGSSSIRSSVNRELIKQATTRRRLRKRHLKSEVALLQTLSRLLYLFQFVKCWQFFLELNSKRLYWSLGKENKVVVLCSHSPQNVKFFRRRSRAVTVKKRTWCLCRVDVAIVFA